MYTQKLDKRLVKTGQYVGLKFQEGWLFFHVLDTEYVELKPWVLLNEDNERAEIAPMTAGSEDDEITDEVDRKLVEPKQGERNLFFQLFMGVAPSRVQIFPRFGRDRTPNLTGGSEPGKPQLFVTGHDSPYNNPSAQSELFNVNAMKDLALQAYNPMTEATEAKISFHVNKMKYAVIDDPDLMLSFIQGQVPFRDHSMGLSVQSNEQLRAPSWLDDRFGDAMMTTQEIVEQSSREVQTAEGNGGGIDGVRGLESGGE